MKSLRSVIEALAKIPEVPPERYQIADLVLDTGLQQVSRGPEIIELPQLSFDLLLELARAAPNVVATDELMDRVWRGVVVNPETVAKRVELLREALGDDSQAPRYIRAIRGRGYRLIAKVNTPQKIERSRTTWLAYALLSVVVLIAVFVVLRSTRPGEEPAPANSIAVLPFEYVGGDATDETLAIGIHDDVITQIAKIGGLRVISRNSVMQLEQGSTVESIGQRLNVATILEGTVQRTGDRIRVNVQLIDALTNEHRWAENYDRRVTAADIFDIQSEIATAVAAALRSHLTPDERARIRLIPTQNLAAYEAYLLGRRALAERSLAEAARHLLRAIELDPQFALAYVSLADTYLLQYHYFEGGPELVDDAADAVDKAFALNDSLGEAYNSLGALLEATDPKAAERAFQRAIELSPSYAPAYHWYANLLQSTGRSAEALVQAYKALELDPLTSILRMEVAELLEDLGRFDDALTQYRRILELDPDDTGAYAGIAEIYWHAFGRLDEAMIWYRRSMTDGKSGPSVAFLGLLYYDLGDFVQARRWIDRSLEVAPGNALGSVAKAIISAHDGDWEQSERYADATLAAAPKWPVALWMRLVVDVREGRYADARARYAAAYPALLTEAEPGIDRSTLTAAVDVAIVLIHTGERERAELLLERAQQYEVKFPRAGTRGAGTAARVLAIRGNDDAALHALQQAVDSGWRGYWRSILLLDPAFTRLHGTPGFRAMLEELDADMAVQLARVAEKERNGELAPLPQQYTAR